MPRRGRPYPREFKAEAVHLHRSSDKSIRDIAGPRDLSGVPEALGEPARRATRPGLVADLGADVIGVVEAEDRLALKRFNDDLLKLQTEQSYDHILLIDGNDDRGIDGRCNDTG